MKHESPLPKGWALTSLAEIAQSSGGSTPSTSNSSYWTNGEVPWVSPKDMKAFDITSTIDKVARSALEKLVLVPVGSVLVVVRSGILSRTLPVALNSVPVTMNQDMRAFTCMLGISARFIAWQLLYQTKSILDNCSKDGTTVASIDCSSLARFPLAIPPAGEQVRIVYKVEELLSDIDAGVAELKAAQKKLTKYRQSLLMAAVSGTLTATWRRNSLPDCCAGISGTQLLDGLRAKRRSDRASEATSASSLPMIPLSWAWATAEELCDFITKGTTPSKTSRNSIEKEVPFIRVTNLTSTGAFDFEDQVFVSLEVHRNFLARSKVFPGDVLMNIVGPPLGQVSVVPPTYPEWNINQAVAIFRAVDGVLPGYLCILLLSPIVQHWLKAHAKTTAGQTNLTLQVCRDIPMPVPSPVEQEIVVERVRAAWDAIDAQEFGLKGAIDACSAQRQNILKAAFSGQLVPQNPADEPASVLLDRIRAERAARPVTKPSRGRKGRAAA